MNIIKIYIDEGPSSVPDNFPSIIVTHAMGEFIRDGNGEFGPKGKIYHFLEWLRILGYSAHGFIEPSGRIIQAREWTQGAWHCSANHMNYIAIGIEWIVEGIHDITTLREAMKGNWVSDAQLVAGAELYSMLMRDYNIKKLTQHRWEDPQGKEDPGEGFPQQLLENLLSDKQ